MWCCPEHGLFDEDERFEEDQPVQDAVATAAREVFAEPTGETSTAFEISDMGAFREACLRAADGKGFHLPPGIAKVKS